MDGKEKDTEHIKEEGGKFEYEHEHTHSFPDLKNLMGGSMYNQGTSNAAWALGGFILAEIFGRGRGGFFGGHDGFDGRGRGRRDDDDCFVNKFELKQAEVLACKEAEIAELKSERFTLLTEAKLGKEICELKAEVAALKVKEHSDVRFLEKEDKCIKQWVKAHFIEGQLVLPSTPTVTGFPSADADIDAE